MKKISYIILAVIIIVAGYSLLKNKKVDTKNTSISAKQETLKLGYIVYPPLLKKDSSTGELSGISYDIVMAVAEKISRDVEWTEEVGWGTALEGLKTNRYNILGTQMWPNEERSQVADFSSAPMESVLYPYVRADETRFDKDLNLINNSDIKISAVDGELAVFIAADDYPKATLNALSQLSSYAEVYLNIVQNKADVAFTEPSAANDFLKNNPGTIKKVDVEPIRSFGNSFAFPKNDPLIPEWNTAIESLIVDGTIFSILEKYDVEKDYLIR